MATDDPLKKLALDCKRVFNDANINNILGARNATLKDLRSKVREYLQLNSGKDKMRSQVEIIERFHRLLKDPNSFNAYVTNDEVRPFYSDPTSKSYVHNLRRECGQFNLAVSSALSEREEHRSTQDQVRAKTEEIAKFQKENVLLKLKLKQVTEEAKDKNVYRLKEDLRLKEEQVNQLTNQLEAERKENAETRKVHLERISTLEAQICSQRNEIDQLEDENIKLSQLVEQMEQEREENERKFIQEKEQFLLQLDQMKQMNDQMIQNSAKALRQLAVERNSYAENFQRAKRGLNTMKLALADIQDQFKLLKKAKENQEIKDSRRIYELHQGLMRESEQLKEAMLFIQRVKDHFKDRDMQMLNFKVEVGEFLQTSVGRKEAPQ